MNQGKIEQYVAGKLGREEAEAFEAYCVANPEFAKQVEFEQRLRDGIREVAAGSTAEFVRANHPMRWKVALAASLILVVAGALFVWQRTTPPVISPVLAAVTSEAQRSGPSMRLALVRGVDSAPELQRGFVRVEIVGLFDPGFHYTVSLDRFEQQKNVETIGTLYSQHPTSPITLEVMIDSDRLESGAYSLRVRRQASGEEPLDFGFLKP
ncbi:MAG: hypothetical protein H7Y89_00390 [Steroidobacteraceae bacterium]|nr:hypothetical protein [Steroidobacteraceae bacterium]